MDGEGEVRLRLRWRCEGGVGVVVEGEEEEEGSRVAIFGWLYGLLCEAIVEWWQGAQLAPSRRWEAWMLCQHRSCLSVSIIVRSTAPRLDPPRFTVVDFCRHCSSPSSLLITLNSSAATCCCILRQSDRERC